MKVEQVEYKVEYKGIILLKWRNSFEPQRQTSLEEPPKYDRTNRNKNIRDLFWYRIITFQFGAYLSITQTFWIFIGCKSLKSLIS